MTFDGNESGNAANTPQAPSGKPARKPRVKRAARSASKTSMKAARQKYEQEEVELLPSGISVSTSIARPVLVLKDRTGVEVLPVWMQPLDASVAMAELSHTAGATPHSVTRKLLAMMTAEVVSCTFVDLVGHHQFVDINVAVQDSASENADQKVIKTLRVRADEAMSFCLQARAKFYCSRALMARCRDLDADLSALEQNLNEGLLPNLQSEMETSSKKQPYVM